jgi:hypothetical protein
MDGSERSELQTYFRVYGSNGPLKGWVSYAA